MQTDVAFTTSFHITLALQGLLARGESQHPESLINRGGGEIGGFVIVLSQMGARIAPASLHVYIYMCMYVYTLILAPCISI